MGGKGIGSNVILVFMGVIAELPGERTRSIKRNFEPATFIPHILESGYVFSKHLSCHIVDPYFYFSSDLREESDTTWGGVFSVHFIEPLEISSYSIEKVHGINLMHSDASRCLSDAV